MLHRPPPGGDGWGHSSLCSPVLPRILSLSVFVRRSAPPSSRSICLLCSDPVPHRPPLLARPVSPVLPSAADPLLAVATTLTPPAGSSSVCLFPTRTLLHHRWSLRASVYDAGQSRSEERSLTSASGGAFLSDVTMKTPTLLCTMEMCMGLSGARCSNRGMCPPAGVSPQ